MAHMGLSGFKNNSGSISGEQRWPKHGERRQRGMHVQRGEAAAPTL